MSPYPTKDTWVLVCDGSHAKIFVNSGPNDGLRQIRDADTDIRKIRDLITGGRGRNRSGVGQNHAYSQPNPREAEKEAFIKRIAQAINDNERFMDRLIIAAPPKALHTLRQELSPQVQRKLSGEINKDLTKNDTDELPQYLGKFLNIADPLERGTIH